MAEIPILVRYWHTINKLCWATNCSDASKTQAIVQLVLTGIHEKVALNADEQNLLAKLQTQQAQGISLTETQQQQLLPLELKRGVALSTAEKAQLLMDLSCCPANIHGVILTNALSQILQTLADDQAANDDAATFLLTLLQEKNAEGYHLGQLLARHADQTLMLTYQKILVALHRKKKNIWPLLTDVDHYFCTLGHFIARYQSPWGEHTTTQHYINRLTGLCKEGKAEDVFNVLTQQNFKGNNFGHEIALYQNSRNIHHYFALLSLFIKDKNTTATIALLKQMNHEGWHLGHMIARHQDFSVMQTYLQLLTQLIKNGNTTDIDNIGELLLQKTLKSENLGHLMAACHYDQGIFAYFALLTTLVQAGKAALVFTLLAQQDRHGCNLSHYITKQKNPGLVVAYCELLHSLEPRHATALLTQRNDGAILHTRSNKTQRTTGLNFGHAIARCTEHSERPSIEAYLTLLTRLLEQGEFRDVLSLLRQTEAKGWHLKYMIKHCHDQALLSQYQALYGKAIVKLLASEGYTSIKTDTALFIKYKDHVKNYLNGLKEGKTTRALLLKCLDKSAPLGIYCHTLRGVGAYFCRDNDENNTIQLIKQKLNIPLNNVRRTWFTRTPSSKPRE